MDVRLLRTVGAATAVYGVAVAARPEWLARPSGLTDERDRVTGHIAASLRPLGWRDAVGGLAMLLAPAGPALRTAAVLRAAADVGDAALLGATLPPNRRAPAVAVSLGWGALTVAGLLRRHPARPGRPRLRAGRR